MQAGAGVPGTVATYAPCHHNLAPCASVRWSLVWVSYSTSQWIFYIPESDKCLSLCQRPALSRRDPHHQSWRTEDEKVTQVLVCPHRFQLIFLDFSLASLFPVQLCSRFPTLLKSNSYLRGNVFYRDFIVILIHTPYCKSSNTRTQFPSD